MHVSPSPEREHSLHVLAAGQTTLQDPTERKKRSKTFGAFYSTRTSGSVDALSSRAVYWGKLCCAETLISRLNRMIISNMCKRLRICSPFYCRNSPSPTSSVPNTDPLIRTNGTERLPSNRCSRANADSWAAQNCYGRYWSPRGRRREGNSRRSSRRRRQL